MNKQQFLFNLFRVIETGDGNDVRICIMEGIKNFEEQLDLSTRYLKNNKNILDYQDETGKTPLMRAAELGKADVVDLIIQYGANVNLADNKGRTALIYAAKYGHKEVVETLVKNKAELDAVTIHKHSALHYTALYNQVEVAAILAKNGANTNLRDDRGKYPFMLNNSEEFKRAVIEASMVYFNKRVKKVKNKALMEDKKRRGLL